MTEKMSKHSICILLKAFETCVSENGGDPYLIEKAMELIGCHEENLDQ